MRLHNLRMILTLKCEGATRLLSDVEDRHLNFAERLALRGHLLACLWCRRYREQIRLLDRLAAHWPASRAKPASATATELSGTAKERIRATVIAEMERRNGSGK